MNKLFQFFVLICVMGIIVSCDTNIKAEYAEEDIWYLYRNDKEKNFELFVKEVGVGDTIVVVHGGFGAEHSYLLDVFKGMEKDFHFVYYDQRGSLRSPVADSLITAQAHIEDLEALRKELGIKKMNLFGHSMGTWVANAYLNQYPDHVSKMTLLGLVWPRLRENMNEEEQKLDDQAGEAWSAFIRRDAINEQYKIEELDKRELNSREATHRWRIRFASVNMYDVSNWRNIKGGLVFYNQKAGTAAGSTMPRSYDWINTYQKNPSVQITVVNGTHDFVDFGGKLHSKWLQPMSNVDYNLIENAGHNAWLDKPEEVRTIIKNSFK